MNSTNRIIIAAIAVLVLAGGAFWYSSTTNKTAAPAESNNETPTPSGGDIAATIVYDGNGFELSTTKIAVGTQVKVINNSSETLDFASDPHPVHTDNTELNTGDIPAGESKTFTVTQKGAWGFHNHLNAKQRGSITVE